VVGALLVLHGLHPLDLKARVTRALQEMRPHLASHGGTVELVAIEDGRATLRLAGSCNGCSSSNETLKTLVEEQLYQAVPDLESIQLEEGSKQPPKQGVPVTFVAPRRRKNEKENDHAPISS
jgi:Fe-S cluster biogenesis protein NfuA